MRIARHDDERGSFMVLYALLVVALMTMAAIAVDLAGLRQDRRLDRSVTDTAASAGAFKLGDSVGSACDTAWAVAARNLGSTAPASPCGSLPTVCPAVSPTPYVTGTVGSYQVTITWPVPDASPLMNAEATGGDKTQAATLTHDSDQCSRLAVTVSLTRTAAFAGVLGSRSNSTTVHSVARGITKNSPGAALPALVALDPTHCKAIDAEPGTIHVFANNNVSPQKPGILQADSDASDPGCSSASGVLNTQGSGQLITDTDNSNDAGLLSYYASANGTAGYTSGGNYTGTLSRQAKQVTRKPLDAVYRCTTLPASSQPAGCTTDYIGAVLGAYSAGVPTSASWGTGGSGFNTFPGAAVAGTCAAPPATFPIFPAVPSNNWYINCPSPTGLSVGGTVVFPAAGIIVFTGNINIAGGTVRVNTLLNDASGAPIATTTGDSLIVLRGADSSGYAVALQNSNSHLFMAHTSMVTTEPSTLTTGGLSFQGGPDLHWTPNAGTTAAMAGLKNLLFWTEAATSVNSQGGPTFKSGGIFAMPNAQLYIGGKGTLDASDVQFWCYRAQVNNASAIFLLRPDPNSGISTVGSGSALIR